MKRLFWFGAVAFVLHSGCDPYIDLGALPVDEGELTQQGGASSNSSTTIAPGTCPDPTLNPKVHYVSDSYNNPKICMVILFSCQPGQTLFSEACGCGCVDP